MITIFFQVKKNENLLHVLYDKTAKAEHNKQIELKRIS